MKSYCKIIFNELRHIFYLDRRRGILLMLASVAYMLVFSWLYLFGVVKEVPLLVVDQSNTVLSRQLARDFADSDGFRLEAMASSTEAAEEWLTHNRHCAALYIPPDFATNIARRQQSEVLVAMEGSNIILTSNSSIAAVEVLRKFNARTAQQLLERDARQLPGQGEQRTAPVRFRYRLLHNPQLDYLIFFVYGLALVALQQGVLLSVAAGVLWNGNRHLPEELAMGTYGGWLLKSGVYWILGILSYAACLALGRLCFNLPVLGDWRQHLLLGGSFVFCLTQLGGLLALIADDELLFSRLSIFYTVPAFMLSGYTWPLEAMPAWVRAIAYCSPFTYLASAARSLCLGGVCHDLPERAALLLLLGLLCFPGAAKMYRKGLRRAAMS